MLDTKFETLAEGMEKLEKAVIVRNQMGGALYWNICNDDCTSLAIELMQKGADSEKINKLLN